MFKQRLMLSLTTALAASLATQVTMTQGAMAQCRGGGNGGGRMGSMGGQMAMMRGPMVGGQMGMMANQMMGNQMGMGGPMMMQQGQGQGRGQGSGGGMCMGQMNGQMGNGNLSAMPIGFSNRPGMQTPNGIYAQILPSAAGSQASTGAGRGQTQQQSVLATFDANGSGKLEGQELKAAQAAASQRRHRSRN